MKPVWIVDDDRSIRWVFEKALSREGIAFNSFASAHEALDALAGGAPQVLVSDIRMPGQSGHRAAAGSEGEASGGAGHRHDRLLGPGVRGRRVPGRRLRIPAQALRRRPGGRADPPRAGREPARAGRRWSRSAKCPEILGQAPAMQEVFRAIGRLSQSSATVLITGESGTGKELVARALHRHSTRAAKPFVAINTAAMPKDLLESELFGHERGAFTGAQALRRGRFEQAEGGTLFLDEIGDMPAELQTRLLRVLSDGTFYRVGGHQQIKANVRVIAATHQDLEARVREGAFREDLYHRLNVIRVRLPSLRERARGHSAAGAAFPRARARRSSASSPSASPTKCSLTSRGMDFPGNVRQLENLCHWLTVMAPGQAIDVADLPAEFRGEPAASSQAPASDWVAALEQEVERRLARGETGVMDQLSRQFERSLIAKALARTGGRRIEAANLLGMGRNTITRKIQELGIGDADD